MRVDSIYRKSIIDSLKNRYNNIEDSFKQTLSGTIRSRETNLDLYFEISYFVESIIQNELTRNLFESLLGYENSIQKSEGYLTSINEIKKIVLEIVQELSVHKELKKFTSISNHWKNPFLKIDGQPLVYEFKELLNQLSKNFGQYIDYQISDDTFHVLSDAINKWHSELNSDFEQNLIDKYNELHRQIKELEYHTGFKRSFLYVRSAQNIHLIYFALNPRLISDNVLTSMMTGGINKGECHISNNDLVQDCKKILNYLELELNNTQSIELIVSRFKAFMELYQTDNQIDERGCQKEFERFLFLNGYYPISEARLGSGRLDSLAFDVENAFLYEHKYVKSLTDLNRKLKSSAIQASIYHSRLQNLPRISSNVFIIIFTLKTLEIEGSSSIVINGVTFFVVVISLDKSAPSTLKNTPKIKLNDVIKET